MASGAAAAPVGARAGHDDSWDSEIDAEPPAVHSELWAGADATRSYWSVWSGMTYAPFDEITKPGLRFRAVAGGGMYRYQSHMLAGGRPRPVTFQAASQLLEGLVGYHAAFGPLTLKSFAGIAVEEHLLSPADPLRSLAGRRTGLKLALEGWLSLGPAWWASLDGAWASVHDRASSRARIGWRLVDDLSLGLEAGLQADSSQAAVRAGGLVRYAWPGGEAWLAGGMVREEPAQGSASARPSSGGYLSGSLLVRW
jgi:hypothetical protein